MDSTTVLTAVLVLIAGIGVFLTACSMLSSNIESLGSKKLKSIFSKASRSKLSGVGIGAATTAAIQSSGATTIMTMGFVNAGIMAMPLAATIIFGSKIGTTITAQLAALGTIGGSISLSVIFGSLAGVGAIVMAFCKKDSHKIWGGIITGFGLLFLGLWLMTESMSGFAQLPEVKEILGGIHNIFILLLLGIALSALAQSSSVVTTLVIAMIVAGLIDLEQGIYLALGSNIGACLPVMLAGYSGTTLAKRTAWILMLFNIIGVTVLMIVGFVMGFFGLEYSDIFAALFPGSPSTGLAMFHTASNVVMVIMMLPLTEWMIRVIERIVPDDKSESSDEPKLHYLNEYLLKTPPLAVQQVQNEVVNMSKLSMTNFSISFKMIRDMSFDDIDTFKKNEKELNYLNKEIARFLVKLSELKLSDKDQTYISTVYHTISDLERIGDYSENIVEYAQKMSQSNERFSDIAIKEIDYLKSLIDSLYEKIIDAYTTGNRDVLEEAYQIEDKVDEVTTNMANNHIVRLNNGICTLEVGAEFLSMTSDAERIADHLINVGKTIRMT